MTVTVSEYLISIDIDCFNLISPFISSSFNFDWEDISNTQYRVWPHLKTIHIRQKYSAARGILNSVFRNVVKHGLLCFIWHLNVYFRRGTMDVTTTKMLSIHIDALLPPTSAELDLPHSAQVAAILGVGLVYQATTQRRMAEVLLSEIGNWL